MHWTKTDKAEEIKLRISLKKIGISNPHEGHPNPYKGKKIPWLAHTKPHSQESKEKMRLNASIRIGAKNNKWKGDNVGIGALHQWIKRQLGYPKVCEKCGFYTDNPNKIHWANKSHEYKRDVTDWIRLCVPCHKRYDLDFIKQKSII